MDKVKAMKLINEIQATGAANNWNMLDKLLHLIDRVESLKESEAPLSSPSSVGLDGLFGAVEWINGMPILDGMKYFETKDSCLEYVKKQPEERGVIYTIIRLEKAD